VQENRRRANRPLSWSRTIAGVWAVIWKYCCSAVDVDFVSGVSRLVAAAIAQSQVHAPTRSASRSLARAFPRFLCYLLTIPVPLGTRRWEHRIIHCYSILYTIKHHPHHVHPPIMISTARTLSADYRIHNDIHGASKTPLWLARQSPSVTNNKIEQALALGNDSRRLRLSDTPPKLYPTYLRSPRGLVYGARDDLGGSFSTHDSGRHCRVCFVSHESTFSTRCSETCLRATANHTRAGETLPDDVSSTEDISW
jgi:hypothetical protein